MKTMSLVRTQGIISTIKRRTDAVASASSTAVDNRSELRGLASPAPDPDLAAADGVVVRVRSGSGVSARKPEVREKAVEVNDVNALEGLSRHGHDGLGGVAPPAASTAICRQKEKLMSVWKHRLNTRLEWSTNSPTSK